MRNYIDIIDANSRQESEIKEMAALFEALALRQVMLNEGRLDEAGVWNAVKSAVGKGVEGVKSANDAINRLGQLAQNTAPVQGFDTKVDGILQKIGAANPKLADTARKYGEWAKQNPVKQGLIIGMLTAVASLVAGPAGAAAAGSVLRAGNEMLKGEKASTAIGKGVKTAAVGAGLSFLAGVGIDQVKDALKSAEPVLKQLPVENMTKYVQTVRTNGRVIFSVDQVIPKEVVAQVDALMKQAFSALNTDNDKAASLYAKVDQILNNPQMKQKVVDTFAKNDAIIGQNKELRALYDAAKEAVNQRNDTINQFASMIKTASNGIIQGGAASGLAGKAGAAVSKAGAAIKGAFGGNKTAAAPQAGSNAVPGAEPSVAVKQPQQPAAAPQQGFKKNISQLGNQPAAQPGPGTVPTAEPGVAVQQPAAQAQPTAAKPQPGQKWQPAWKNKKVQGTTTTTQTFKEGKKFSYKLSIGE